MQPRLNRRSGDKVGILSERNPDGGLARRRCMHVLFDREALDSFADAQKKSPEIVSMRNAMY